MNPELEEAFVAYRQAFDEYKAAEVVWNSLIAQRAAAEERLESLRDVWRNTQWQLLELAEGKPAIASGVPT